MGSKDGHRCEGWQGCHSFFQLAAIADNLYLRADPSNEDNTINGVLQTFMLRGDAESYDWARKVYATAVEIGNGFAVSTMLAVNLHRANSEAGRGKTAASKQFHSTSGLASGFVLEIFPAATLALGDEYYRPAEFVMNPLAGVELRRSAHNLADVHSLMVRPSHASKYRTLVAAPTNVAINGLAVCCLKRGGGITPCMRKYGQKITACHRSALEAILLNGARWRGVVGSCQRGRCTLRHGW